MAVADGALTPEPARPPQPTLCQRRQARGSTQQEVAEQVGVRRKQVNQWEAGIRLPRPATWQRLADGFSVGVGRSPSERVGSSHERR